MLRLRELLTTFSKYRYLLWRAIKSNKSLNVRLRSGEYLSLRQEPITDLGTAYEIFVAKIYMCPRPLEPASMHCIVDVGANVGFSLVFWIYQYTKAHILAYEPNPVHLEQIQTHLKVNQATQRVSIRPVAAGTENKEMYLTNEGAKSKICLQSLDNTIKVPVIDWFNDVKDLKIDLLKIDIEGGEYSLLADTRFAQVKARVIVLEWHAINELLTPADWCKNRLNELGYEVLIVNSNNAIDTGLIWGFRES